MSDEKPSPGPWRWDNLDENSRVLRHSGSDDTYYSSVFHPDIDGVGVHLSDADAALIADAPRLRDENKAMRELLREVADVPLESTGDAYEDRCLVSRGSGWHRRVRALLDKHARLP